MWKGARPWIPWVIIGVGVLHDNRPVCGYTSGRCTIAETPQVKNRWGKAIEVSHCCLECDGTALVNR